MTGDDGLHRALKALAGEWEESADSVVRADAYTRGVVHAVAGCARRLRAILAEHPPGDSTAGWVSVKERLPEHNDPIFAYRPSLSFRQVTPLLFAGEFADDVTAWMPMAFPEPPRDGGDI